MTDAPDGFGRLHPSVRYLVREVLRFPALHPVQAQTIIPVLERRDIVVLAPTAGGKTEAAALPLLSRILSEGWAPVAALVVCPLRALLNNQEPRLARMAEAVGLTVGKWHGDVGYPARQRLVRSPPHLLLITPESLEVLLLSPSDRADRLLNRIQVAVIDEVHAFAADARGAHLLSVLERLQRRRGGHIQRIGLSATVGNPEDLAGWLQGSEATAAPVVINPGGDRKTPRFRFLPGHGTLGSAQGIEAVGAGQKRLVFVESRSRAEELARALQTKHSRVWVHHSSVGTGQRALAETAFENVPDSVLVATSSLELGIDIGDLDHIFQQDAPSTVSSLAQRLGRTGRRPDTVPQLTFLPDGPETLLLGLALAELYLEGWVEDLKPSRRLWTVLVHQVFANLLESGGVTQGTLLERVRQVPSFSGFEAHEVEGLVRHLEREGWLQRVDGVLVLGQRAEKVFGARNFFKLYAVFESPNVISMRSGSEEIGTLQRWFALQLGGVGKVFRLAGRSWEVVDIDLQRGILRARPARGGLIPTWSGRPQLFSRTVCERIMDLLKSERAVQGCDVTTLGWLVHARGLLCDIPVSRQVRPVVREEKRHVWHTFAGARINLVLARLLTYRTGMPTSISNLSVKIRSRTGDVRAEAVRIQEQLLHDELPPLAEWAEIDTESQSAVLSSFQACLPAEAEQEFLREVFFDVPGAVRWAGDVEVG